MDKLFQYATKLNTVYDKEMFAKWVKRIVEKPELFVVLAINFEFYDEISEGIAEIKMEDIEFFDTKATYCRNLIMGSIDSSCRFSFSNKSANPVTLVDVFIYDGELERQRGLLNDYISELTTSIDRMLSYDLPCEPQQMALNLAKDYLEVLDYLAK